MQVEMYVGTIDRRWHLINIEIPEDTPNDKIDEVAEDVAMDYLANHKNTDVAFVSVYHIGD